MNNTPIAPLVRDALDPTQSVVVEACAGSGKTWLLVSRIIRLLIDGAAPSEILAITYTRKAAQEMQARLNDWLRELAIEPEEKVRAFLRQRALSDAEITLALPRVRGLFELALTSRPALTINTFHGWFLDLLQRAPLNAGAAGNVALLEQTSPLIEEAWQALAEQLLDAPDSPIAHALNNIFRDYGLTSTRNVLQRFINKRAEWWRYTHEQAPDQRVAYALDQLQEELGVTFDEPILEPLFADELLIASLEKFALLLEKNGTSTDIKYAATIRDGLTETDLAARFEKIYRAFFKQDGEPYARGTSKARADRLKAEAEAQYVKLNERITARLGQAKNTLIEQGVLCFNRDALYCGEALLAHYQRLKDARGLLDFTDIEYRTHSLLTEDDHAAYMQYKLDARYRHILLDEFQDTNPLQWQILKSWFDAAVGAERTPQVFVVGDPKQSIYRFRGADARLFNLAKQELGEHFGARHLTQDASWRNAQPILDVVNRLFAAEPAFTSFQPHHAHQSSLPGQVWLLPLETKAEAAEAAQIGLRNPLTTPLQETAESAHQREAERIASSIQAIVGQWAITDKGTRRAAEYRDIMLLTRMRTHLRVYEDALKRAGIPFLTSRRGGLLETLEARDLSALLEFLVLPYADLKLAQVLRSPLFSASDDDLLALAQAGEGSWWRRLNGLIASGSASESLTRAHALLNNWRHASDQLPVHDLLDRIYHQGEVLARYRRAIPPAMADSVEANLLSYLELSLTLEGGRYPSLPKFIDELAVLRRARDEEAPDEGQVADAENAVHIYTVHGAKGLERPIVWLVDAHRVTPAKDAYSALVDWAPGESAPAHFSLTSTQEERGQARAPHFAREADLLQREELNLLYVAMTRAQQYLIVSGSEAKNSQRPSWYARLASVMEANNDLTPPDQAPLAPSSAIHAPPQSLHTAQALPEIGPACGQRAQTIETPAMRHGTLLHRLLEQLAPSGTLSPNSLPRAGERDLGSLRELHKLHLRHEWAITEDSFETLWREAQAILSTAHLARFFDPAHYHRAWNELPFLTANGDFLRIDRLVEFETEIWVLDYKSTEAATPATLAQAAKPHRAQLQNYLAAMQSLFPGKQMKGGLIFKSGLMFEISSPK
ncbi:MAG: UvrD-helicase domain-containing protein [Burkholderiales bacterium]|nr:UvrD-helicase domain-containing protein [Burkholderiales bacterium]